MLQLHRLHLSPSRIRKLSACTDRLLSATRQSLEPDMQVEERQKVSRVSILICSTKFNEVRN